MCESPYASAPFASLGISPDVTVNVTSIGGRCSADYKCKSWLYG